MGIDTMELAIWAAAYELDLDELVARYDAYLGDAHRDNVEPKDEAEWAAVEVPKLAEQRG